MTDHGIRDEWSTRKDGERGEQGNQVWEVSRRHFASPWLSNRYCTLETIQKGSASRARERCLCLRPMLHGNHAGAPLLPPFYSFPLCTMRCSVILLPLTFMLLSDRTIDRRCTFSVFEKFAQLIFNRVSIRFWLIELLLGRRRYVYVYNALIFDLWSIWRIICLSL